MITSEVASRYAKGLYQLASENKTQDRVFEDLRVIRKMVEESPEILNYFQSPVVAKESREKVLQAAFAGRGLSTEVTNFMFLLGHKLRLGLLLEIIHSYQDQIDAAHQVTRGTVESAIALSPDERSHLESIVRKVTGKEVILTYKTNPTVIGGLVARVGGYTFDDTIQSHLTRMNEDLKRRAN